MADHRSSVIQVALRFMSHSTAHGPEPVPRGEYEMHIQRVSAFFALLIIGLQPASWAATANPNAARGKKALYVYNQIKLEKARTAQAADLKRIAQLESWRKNDED